MTEARPDLDRLSVFLREEEAADRFSGVVVIERGGAIVFSGAYGHAHLGLDVPNCTDTRFNTASITKMFTTVAVLQLVEQGVLSLDATVSGLELLQFGMALRANELLGERSVRLMLPPPHLGGPGFGTQQIPYSRRVMVGGRSVPRHCSSSCRMSTPACASSRTTTDLPTSVCSLRSTAPSPGRGRPETLHQQGHT